MGGGTRKGGGFKLTSRYCFVTWSRSREFDPEVFRAQLEAKFPVGTQMFGCREFHGDGSPHYHVVFGFPHSVHWPDARSRFLMSGRDGELDTSAIHIDVPRRGEAVGEFLDRLNAYVDKEMEAVTFGSRVYERPVDTEPVAVSRRCNSCSVACRAAQAMWCGRCVGDGLRRRDRQVSYWYGREASAVIMTCIPWSSAGSCTTA